MCEQPSGNPWSDPAGAGTLFGAEACVGSERREVFGWKVKITQRPLAPHGVRQEEGTEVGTLKALRRVVTGEGQPGFWPSAGKWVTGRG